MRDYKKLNVWVKSYTLGIYIYSLSKSFPKEELYGLTSQVRRSAISIPSNIAEGSRRSTEKDFRSFLHIAYGSGAELEVQILFAKDLKYISTDECKKVLDDLDEVMKMLNALITKLS